MSTFALVHGAWRWERLAPLLEVAGHDVVAMDLPIDDGSADFDDHAEVVCAALRGYNDVVVVGHSFGGCVIPLVAARRAVRHLVYLCAAVPDVGRSFDDQLADGALNPRFYAGLGPPDAQLRTSWTNLEVAREVFYADCAVSVADEACRRLRPHALQPSSLPFSLSEFPSVPTTSIVCNEDLAVVPEWSRHVARQRLHADLVELPGSHSPFYSRPAVLADVLLRLAAD